jgi:hypothetical protein
MMVALGVRQQIMVARVIALRQDAATACSRNFTVWPIFQGSELFALFKKLPARQKPRKQPNGWWITRNMLTPAKVCRNWFSVPGLGLRMK